MHAVYDQSLRGLALLGQRCVLEQLRDRQVGQLVGHVELHERGGRGNRGTDR